MKALPPCEQKLFSCHATVSNNIGLYYSLQLILELVYNQRERKTERVGGYAPFSRI